MREQGLAGSEDRINAFVRHWQEEQAEALREEIYMPLVLALDVLHAKSNVARSIFFG